MKTSILSLAFLLSLSTSMGMAQQMPQLPIDPQVRIGKLDNGLTYYIRHNNLPKERADLFSSMGHPIKI